MISPCTVFSIRVRRTNFPRIRWDLWEGHVEQDVETVIRFVLMKQRGGGRYIQTNLFKFAPPTLNSTESSSMSSLQYVKGNPLTGLLK